MKISAKEISCSQNPRTDILAQEILHQSTQLVSASPWLVMGGLGEAERPNRQQRSLLGALITSSPSLGNAQKMMLSAGIRQGKWMALLVSAQTSKPFLEAAGENGPACRSWGMRTKERWAPLLSLREMLPALVGRRGWEKPALLLPALRTEQMPLGVVSNSPHRQQICSHGLSILSSPLPCAIAVVSSTSGSSEQQSGLRQSQALTLGLHSAPA